MKKYIRLIILLISFATLFSGAMQVIAPAFVLNFVGAEIDTTTKQLFATIGMFMFLFGAMMVHALYNEENNRVAVIWSGLQKLGASVAVFIGIFNGTFVLLAAGVAIFDLFSGLLFFYYLRKYVIT
ncbi:MAG: patatin [Bacteroidota bacterium]|nr:patatin [Bacteroidota bacterium]MDP3432387.1 patatin [Bacteroidota bacterium]